MKQSKLEVLLKSLEERSQESSFSDFVILNHYQAKNLIGGTTNEGCSSNDNCSNNYLCSGNGACSNNHSCATNPSCEANNTCHIK